MLIPRVLDRLLLVRVGIVLGFLAGGYLLLWLSSALGVLGMVSMARADGGKPVPDSVPGISNFTQVDAHLWRGAAPSAAGYQRLAQLGVRTVVDLRAEDLPASELERPIQAGLKVVRIPIRDGQAPSPADVARFLAVVKNEKTPVFVHCGAGVGRTGSMSAAYLVNTGQANASEATRRSLAVGPPTLEQITFMRGLDDGIARPPATVRALSRVADSPRRIWSNLT